jgi:hypothetical protein
LEKLVEVVKGRILAGWARKSPEPWHKLAENAMVNLIWKESMPLDGRGRGKENILCTFSLHEDNCGCQVWKVSVGKCI